MNMQVRPMPNVNLLPESAPFTPEQRDWLNGFFVALLQSEAQAASPALPVEEEDAPWHDAAMALPDRMKLAESKPLQRRMFAAMAQQDCGQCGYVCETYSAALAKGEETRLNLCAPGGKDTLRMLKTLAQELEANPQTPVPASVAVIATPPVAPLGTRENPAEISFLQRRRLNKSKSEKETFHIDFDLSGSGLEYAPGDSFGIFPVNDPRLVDAVISLIGARPEAPIATANGERMLRDVLTREVALGPAPDSLFQLISYVTGGPTRLKAKRLAEGEDPDKDLDRLDVLGTLHKFSGVRIGPEAFVEALDRQQPRLYSISSSPLANPGQLSLTVDKVRYRIGQRERFGVASTYLGELALPGEKMAAYVQKAHGFALPQDTDKPIIMVGPGTGVAPFRSFLQHRQATQSKGRNWLFFGHQKRETDFFYEDELSALQAQGALSRLTLAWSRDSSEKIYVQDRMRQVGADLWNWLQQDAHFYVCGDAKRMARDVERAMVDVVAEHGRQSTESAIAYVANLKKSGRYQADVY